MDLRKPGWLSRHWEFLLLEWSGIFIVYTLRVNISVAAEAMRPELGWSEVEKGLVLSAFYWGYMAGQIPTSIILQMGWMKGIHVFGISVFVPSLLTLLVPIASRYSYITALLTRAVIGFIESASFPTAYHFFRKWYPENERVVMISTFMSASYFGEIVGFLLSGVFVSAFGWPSVFYVFGAMGIAWYPFWYFLAYENPRDHPRITKEQLDYIVAGRYRTAAASPLSAADKEAGYTALKQSEGRDAEEGSSRHVAFKSLNVGEEGRESSASAMDNSLLDNKLVQPLVNSEYGDKDEDLNPLQSDSTNVSLTGGEDDPFRYQRALSKAQKVPLTGVPWRYILRSPAFWNLMFSMYLIGWLLFTLLSEIPSYLTDKLHFSVGEAGLLSTVPFGALFVVALTNGYFMDWLRSKYGLSKWTQRFLSQFVHLVITPLLLMICMFFDEEQKWVVYFLLVTATGLIGFQTSGVGVAFLDLFPRFSPLMNTMGNTLGAAAGILGPVIASELLVSFPGTQGWDILFIITAVQCFVGIVIWYMFAKSEVDDLLNTPIAAEEDVE